MARRRKGISPWGVLAVVVVGALAVSAFAERSIGDRLPGSPRIKRGVHHRRRGLQHAVYELGNPENADEVRQGIMLGQTIAAAVA